MEHARPALVVTPAGDRSRARLLRLRVVRGLVEHAALELEVLRNCSRPSGSEGSAVPQSTHWCLRKQIPLPLGGIGRQRRGPISPHANCEPPPTWIPPMRPTAAATR